MSIDPEKVADEILSAQDKALDAIRILLDQKLATPNEVPVFRARMGKTESYVASVTFSWIRANVGFAHNLPLFSNKIDINTKKIEVDLDTIDLLMQRPLDWSRQGPMAQYLLARRNHKFPPILTAISDAWIDDPNSDNWSPIEGIALSSAAEFTPLNSDGRFGLLRLSESSQLFALDGQHRLLAIEGALELTDQGSLALWSKDRLKQTGTLTKEQLQSSYPWLTNVDLQKVKMESIGIEILPAVTVGETREEARRRIRTIFVHVNRLAAPLGKSQMSALDEDDGFRIVARTVATGHALLKPIEMPDGKRLNRVDFEKSNLNSKSEELTTLETISNGAKGYLIGEPYSKWDPQVKGLVPLRPEEDQLDKGVSALTAFYDYFMDLPSIMMVRQGVLPRNLREFNVEGGKRNLLMRPVGQIVLATAVGLCQFEAKMSLESIFSKLTAFDAADGFDRIDRRTSYWWGILTTTEAEPKMRDSGRGLAIALLQYLLGGADPGGYASLAQKVVTARRTSDEEVINFSGEPLMPGQSLALPPLLVA